MKKILLVLGLMVLPMVATGEVVTVTEVRDSIWSINALGVTAGTINGNDLVWGVTSGTWDTCLSWPRHPDTTRWYIKEIKEKCDTNYIKTFLPADVSGDFYSEIYTRQIKCITDTTWAEKIEVWLQPEQLEKLTKILEAWKN